jgi:hypothetical protein
MKFFKQENHGASSGYIALAAAEELVVVQSICYLQKQGLRI